MACAVTICAGGLVRFASAQVDVLPEPNVPNSHVAHAEALANAEGIAFGDLLARFDVYLEENPHSATAAVERCAFIETSLGDEGGPVEREELADACLAELEERFPRAPTAVLFRLERSWGDEGIALGEKVLAELGPSWSPADRGRARLALAQKLAYTDGKRAADEAQLAMEENPKLDGSLIIADHLIAEGHEADATALLEARLEDTNPRDLLLTKARLLADLGEYETAERALQILEQDPESYVNQLLRAEVLEGLGHTTEARELYLKQSEGYLRSRALARIFDIDLGRGAYDEALASYQALRDDDYWNDPFLRNRIRLAFAYPSAPWAWRDLLGIVAFLAVLLGLALLPALWIVPVHYAGLIRRARGYEPSASSRWTLGLAWIVSAVFLTVDALCTHIFIPEELIAIFLDYVPLRASDDTRPLARYGVASTLAIFACVLMFLRRKDRRFLLRTDWSRSTTIREVAKWYFLLVIVGSVNYTIVGQLGYLDEAAALSLPWASFTAEQVLKAIWENYGTWTLLAIGAVLVPVSEELLFRYILLGAFKRHIAAGWANAWQAILFAIWHDNYAMLPFFFFVGIATGKLRLESGSLLPSMLLHIFWNLLVCLRLVAFFH
jgi:membrane protease YdiL (CAAX protease family)/tetratricopeptide (TPR) repeat protein